MATRETIGNVFPWSALKEKYIADFVCFIDLIVELKAVASITNDHRAQLFNYLRITQSNAGVLINFGNPNHLISERYLYDEFNDTFKFIK